MTKNKKKQEARKSNVKDKGIEQESKVPSYFNYIFGILLLAIFVLSLYFRTVMPYDSVFRNGFVAFASDDSVFQMRLVENTLYNFPNRIFYDAFTMYPYGSAVHWGPLWTQLIASLSLIAGLGSYNMNTVNTIGAFLPAVFGALVVFPTYYIGKQLGNRSTGIVAALMIAVLPGQFFSRSTLGFTDHHVAEVLFSTITMALFIQALKVGRERNIRFSDVKLKEKTVLYSILAGIMLAAFHITWPGTLFFVMIFLVFIVAQFILDNSQGKPTDYLVVATFPMFLIDLISVFPYVNPEYGFNTNNYSLFHVAVPIIGMGLPVVLNAVSNEIRKRGLNTLYYPISLAGLFGLSMLVIKIILPVMYNTIKYAPGIIFEVHTGGAATVAEGTSIFEMPGAFWSNFPLTGSFQQDSAVLLFVIAVLAIIGYRIIRKHRPEDLLFLTWGIIMLLAMYGQNRWAYYFAVNAALIVGYSVSAVSERILRFGGWQWNVDNNYLKNIGAGHMVSAALVIMLLLFFVYPSFEDTKQISTWGGGEPSGGGYGSWIETLNWMRYNTPDPGVDYLAIYKESKNSTYPYPETAYGVMSWWDYGHVITYWAHRIPNANPFQAGIGGGSQHSPGASTFLTAKSEGEASAVLEALGTNGKPGARYIVSNAYMAFSIMDVFGVWNEDYGYRTQVQTRDGPAVVPTRKYYDNMEAKLHIFDGNGLKQYRLVHESPRNPYDDEQAYKNIYNILYGGKIPLENSGLVKVFEYVKGAKITGQAPPNTTVVLTDTIRTSIGRNFQYSQTTSSDGTYVFTVPYSTKGPISGETNFDAGPTGPYTISAGNVSKQIDVHEKDVLDGNTLNLDLV